MCVHYNLDKFQKHYIKRKILKNTCCYHFIYMESPKINKIIVIEIYVS